MRVVPLRRQAPGGKRDRVRKAPPLWQMTRPVADGNVPAPLETRVKQFCERVPRGGRKRLEARRGVQEPRQMRRGLENLARKNLHM